MTFGVNRPWMDDQEASFEPGSKPADPKPSPLGPAQDPHYNGNLNPTPRQTPEGRVAASYFTSRVLSSDPWEPVQPNSLLYRNAITGSLMIRRKAANE
jgi:hypothetical protein